MTAYQDANYGPWLPEKKDTPILDYGCGEGSQLAWLQELGYTNLQGFDINPKAGAGTAAPVATAPDGLSWLRANEGRFGLVLCCLVLDCIPRPAAEWMEALRRSIQPGGLLLLTTPNAVTSAGTYPLWNDPNIRTAYAEFGLRMLMEDAGFVVVHLGGDHPIGTGPRFAAWQALRRLHRARHRLGYLAVRGLDDRNPTIFAKLLLAVGRSVP